MRSASEIFQSLPLWVLDGGLATEIEKKGVDLNHKLWSARALKENPEAVFETHLDYLNAGADILLTASYQASVQGFVDYGMYNREARETIFSSVMLASYAKEKYFASNPIRPVLIGGSCGPYGAILADGSEYTGAYLHDPQFHDNLQNYYADKIEVLLSPRKNFRLDFLAFETLPLVEEAEFIVRHMIKYRGAPITLTFSRAEAAIAAAAKFDKETQVAAIGLNCLDAAEIIKALPELRARTSKPIMVYPNARGEYDSSTKSWKQAATPIDWTELTKQAKELKIKIVGGCCRTTPQDIATIKKHIEST